MQNIKRASVEEIGENVYNFLQSQSLLQERYNIQKIEKRNEKARQYREMRDAKLKAKSLLSSSTTEL